MNIYGATTTDFENNGLGFLTDVLSAIVTESISGDFILTFEYPLNGALNEYLVENNIVKCNTGNSNYQLFRIKYLEKTFKTIKITANHITYDLNDNLVEDCVPTDKSCILFGQYILDHTSFTHNFTFESSITGTKTARYVRKNPIECIIGDLDNSMVNLFGGELLRDNFKLKLLTRRGNDNNVKLLIGKNIQEINVTTDISDLYTRILPLGYDGLKIPEIYVDSPLINNYPTPRIKVVNFENIRYDEDESNEEAYHTLEEAYQALRDAANALFDAGQDKPLINITVNWLELSKTKEYYEKYAYLERVSLGDTIYVDLFDLSYSTRIIKTNYNVLKDCIETFEVGNYKKNIESTLNLMSQDIKKIEPSSIVEDAVNNATKLINSAMGGYVYKTNSELYIMDTNNPNTAQKVWRWNINGLGYSSTGINGPYGIAMTMDGSIVADFITSGKINTNLINGYGDLVIKVGEIDSKISDIADITTSGESSYASVNLVKVNESEPIAIKIHPIGDDISYLYPSSLLYPSSTLYSKTRTVRFTNTDTEEIVDYVLPDDLLYYNSDTYDEFILNYDSETCSIIKRVEYDSATGKNKIKSTEETVNYDYPTIGLTAGNYTVSLLGYTSAYLYVQLMASNIYTTQFATKIEMSNTTKSINLEIEKKVDNTDYTAAQILMKINGDTSETLIKSDKLDVDAIAAFTNSKLANAGSTIINGANITTGTISSSRLSADVITTNNFSAQSINASQITSGTISTARLSSDVITTNNFSAQSINAEKITAGTLSVDRIPNISAGKVTSGTMSADRISGGSLNIGNSTYYLRMQASGSSYTKNPSCSGLTVGNQGLVVNSTAWMKANTNFYGYLNIFNKNLIRIYLGDDTSSSCYTGVSGRKSLTISGHTMTFYNGILVAIS